MITLFKIETFKLFKRMKTWVVLIAFILLTGLVGYGVHSDAKNMKRYNTPEARLANTEDYLKHLEEQKNIVPDDIKKNEAEAEKYKQMIEQQIQDAKREIVNLKNVIEQKSGSDWREALKKSINDLEEQKKGLSDIPVNDRKSRESSLNQEIERLQYLLKHDIKPVEDFDFNATNFLLKLVQLLGEAFLAIGIAVFTADMVSGEATPPTMKLLLAQPVSRAKVLFSKFLSINFASILCIIGVEVVAFLVVGLLFGFGDSNYPMYVGAQYKFDTTQLMENGRYPLVLIEGTKHLIPAWQYLVRMLLLQSLFIIVCTSAVFLVSTLVKTSMVSMGVSVVSVIASMIIFMGFGALKKLARFVFILFGDVGSLLTGDKVYMFNDPSITLNSTIIMFVAWIVITYVISHIVFTKKDILI